MRLFDVKVQELANQRPLGEPHAVHDALAETVNGLYKAELINRRGPWAIGRRCRARDRREVHFWNTRRLHSACGDIPPTEFEAACHQRRQATSAAA